MEQVSHKGDIERRLVHCDVGPFLQPFSFLVKYSEIKDILINLYRFMTKIILDHQLNFESMQNKIALTKVLTYTLKD